MGDDETKLSSPVMVEEYRVVSLARPTLDAPLCD